MSYNTKTVKFLGIPIIKTTESDDFVNKGYSEIYWDKKGNTVKLFNFENSDHIYKAIYHVPELASVLNYIGKSFSSGIYFEQINDQFKEDTPLIKLLKKPNPFYSESEFKQKIITELLSFGVIHIYCNTPSIPLNTKSLFVLPTHLTKPYIGKMSKNEIYKAYKNIILEYHVDIGKGKVLKINSSKVITITLNTDIEFTDNGYVKYISPLKPLEDALQVTPAMYDSMHNIMNNYGMVGFISNKSTDSGNYVPVMEEDKENVHKAINKYGTRKGQRRFGFVNYDLRYTSVSSPIKDMLLPEQQKLIKTIISDILGFDTAILNNDSANKYANYKEARKSLFTENIIPIGQNITGSLNNYFTSNILLDYTHLDVFSEDEAQKADKINKMTIVITSLNKSVMAGEMNRETAVYFLEIEGYTNQEAENLISKPTNQ